MPGNNYYQLDRSAGTSTEKVIVFGEPRGARPKAVWFDLVADPGEQAPQIPTANHPLLLQAQEILAPEEAEAANLNRDALRSLGYIE
jgi:hypothetical protein